MVDSNANGPGELLAQTSSLRNRNVKTTIFILSKSKYLDLLKCEPAASPLLEVVLVSWAGDDRPQLSERARSNLRQDACH